MTEDLLNRQRLEIELARDLGRVFAELYTRTLEELGDPAAEIGEGNGLWDLSSELLQAVIRPVLNKTAFQSAESGLGSMAGIGVNWDLSNQRVAEWASGYTFDLVRSLNNTTRLGLQSAVSRFYSDKWTREELEEQIRRFYSPVRAEMIAVTEVTRAAFQGNRLVAMELQKETGITMVARWQTNNDELVCPICGPLHNVREENGFFRGTAILDGPPAHVRCRCWVSYTYEGE